MVVKASKRGMLAHSLYYWQINDKYFLISELSESSKKFDNNVLKWLEQHNDDERKKLVNNMFKAFNNLGIERITDSIKLKNTIRIIKGIAANINNVFIKNIIIDPNTFNNLFSALV